MAASSFTFYQSYYEALQYLTDDDCGKMFRAICEFALCDKTPEFDSPILKGYWTLMLPTLERSIKRAEAGRLGGIAGAGVSRNNQEAGKQEANEKQTNSKPNSYKEREKESIVLEGEEKEMDEEKGKGEKKGKESNPRRFIPPTVDEVRAYCEARKNGIDAEHFLNYYASRGWKYGNTAIKDWKACVRTWENRGGVKPDGGNKEDTHKLGVGEWIDNDGNRRYGTGNNPPVPIDAPERPSKDSLWSPSAKRWIVEG